MKNLYWALPLATLAAYALLLGYFAPQMMADAGGAWPFDLRLMGYSLAEARAYLTALSPDGAGVYLGPFRLLDTLVPLLVTATLCLPLYRRGQFWFLPALAYGLFDLAENIAVARLLHTGPEVEAKAVALASSFTQAKFAALAIAVLLALYALGRTRWQRR